jgi:integrase
MVHAVQMPAHAGEAVQQPGLAGPKPDWLPALIAQVVAETKREMMGYGKTWPAPAPPSITQDAPAPVTTPTTAEPEPTLRSILPLYLRERQPRPRTAQEIESIVRRFGEDRKLDGITRADARKHKDALLAAGLKPGTINKALGLLSAIVTWSTDNGYRSGENPFRSLSVRQDVAAIEQRKPMSRGQLKEFLGVLEGEDLLLARLAALTGARVGELCKLRRCDVAQEEGSWVIAIGEAGHVKTKLSKRRVPVAKVLVEELLALRADGSERPLWRRPEPAAASKRLNRAIREAGIKDELVVFHSLRHTHIDACRAAGVRPEISDAIHGHSSGNVSARYGSGYPVELLAEAVEKAAGWLGIAWA